MPYERRVSQLAPRTSRDQATVTDRRYRSGESIIQQRQPDRESSANVGSAIDFDRAVVILDHLFCDVETEPGPALSLFGREIRIENFRHLLRSDAASRVLDLHIDVKIFLRATNSDGAFFFRRCLHGIHQDVLNGARDLERIAQKRARILANITLKRDAILAGHRLNTFDDFLHDFQKPKGVCAENLRRSRNSATS